MPRYLLVIQNDDETIQNSAKIIPNGERFWNWMDEREKDSKFTFVAADNGPAYKPPRESSAYRLGRIKGFGRKPRNLFQAISNDARLAVLALGLYRRLRRKPSKFAGVEAR